MSNPPIQEPEEEPRTTNNYGISMYKVPVTIRSIDGEAPTIYEEFVTYPDATFEEFYERIKREEASQEGDRS